MPDDDERQRRAATIQLIVAEERWLDRDELPSVVDTWLRDRRVFSVEFQGRTLLAAYQFDASLRPLPIVKVLIASFGRDHDPWAIAAWFHFPNGYLADKQDRTWISLAPKDCLGRPDKVVNAAKARCGAYVA